MPYTIAQLTTELQTDPKALGYAPHIAAGRMGALADLLNATYAGVGTVWRTDLTAAEIVSCLVWSEISTLTTQNWLALHTVLLPLTVNASIQRIRDIFLGLFAGAPFAGTRGNLTTMAAKASPSRAEELWGHGTAVPHTDVAKALGGS